MKMNRLSAYDYSNKTVLVRIDINSPIDSITKKIVSRNRLTKSIPTLKYLIDSGAKIAIIAHQGDTLDYYNLISMQEHSEILSELLGQSVNYIDDVAGDCAIEAVKNLKSGEIILLGNLRYLAEEISTFEEVVKLTPNEMLDCYLVRRLAPLFQYYINDAFSAAHRNAPSMVAFQELLPSVAGELFYTEIENLDRIMSAPNKPSVFVLGGAKISDAFGMMEQVLMNGTADTILTAGVTGLVFMIADGIDVGKMTNKFLEDRGLTSFIDDARKYLKTYPNKIKYPIDICYAEAGIRYEVTCDKLPLEKSFLDIGSLTIASYQKILLEAKTIFVNGPAGVYEQEIFAIGTCDIWKAIAASNGYSVIGGGDTVSAASKFIDLKDIGYVCTAGGAMVRYLSGKTLPLIKAMQKAYKE